MAHIYASDFIETGPDCDGPRYVRTQPSRETGGVLLNEVTDKYITEFNVPYMNVVRILKTLGKNWDLLSEDQKKAVLSNPVILGALGKSPKQQALGSPTEVIKNLLALLSQDPANVSMILDAMYNSQIPGVREAMNAWYKKFPDWAVGLICGVLVILALLLGMFMSRVNH